VRSDKTDSAVQVRCYSGLTYAGRPQSFTWHDEAVAVEEILSQWREPAGPVFRVRTDQGEFVLIYDEHNDRWWLREG
jgi:hypothetical protein